MFCFHSVDFGGHPQDSQYAPCIFVDNPHKGYQVFSRLHTTQVISHFFLQLVSQDSSQELFERVIPSYVGFSRIEFQFCCLWTRVVSQGVVCLHSVVFGRFLDFYGDFLQRFSWFHPICFFVYVICLGGT